MVDLDGSTKDKKSRKKEFLVERQKSSSTHKDTVLIGVFR